VAVFKSVSSISQIARSYSHSGTTRPSSPLATRQNSATLHKRWPYQSIQLPHKASSMLPVPLSVEQ
jgi:hypothetical protein